MSTGRSGKRRVQGTSGTGPRRTGAAVSRRGGAAIAAVALGALAAPAAWAGPAPAPRPADGGSPPGLGGWTISASAAPVTMEIYDPKIPIPAQPGKPNLEFDISYTRASYGSGPTGAATASWLWPGDAIAFGLGQLFNSPNVKYPILTNVQYPGRLAGRDDAADSGLLHAVPHGRQRVDVGVDVRAAAAGDRAFAAGVSRRQARRRRRPRAGCSAGCSAGADCRSRSCRIWGRSSSSSPGSRRSWTSRASGRSPLRR